MTLLKFTLSVLTDLKDIGKTYSGFSLPLSFVMVKPVRMSVSLTEVKLVDVGVVLVSWQAS